MKASDSDIIIRKVRDEHGWFGNMSDHSLAVPKAAFSLHNLGCGEEVEFFRAEAAFQALRFKGAESDETAKIVEELASIKNPMKAKFFAKGMADYMSVEQLSEEDLENMRLVLALKISQHDEIRDALEQSGDRFIVEDCSKRQRGSGLFWGAALDGDRWRGENWLGRLWMELREKLKG